MVLFCLPLAVPIGLSAFYTLTLSGFESGLVVSGGGGGLQGFQKWSEMAFLHMGLICAPGNTVICSLVPCFFSA